VTRPPALCQWGQFSFTSFHTADEAFTRLWWLKMERQSTHSAKMRSTLA
jgi:hypothetical protein